MIPVKIFAGSGSEKIAEAIAISYGKKLGKCHHQTFSDGEHAFRFDESVRGCNVFLIQSTTPPADNIIELLLMIDAAKRASAQYVTVVIPYFGYARQDRKDRPRVAIAAKLMANIISAAGANRIMTCDLHSGPIQAFFDIPVDHLDGSWITVPYIQSLELSDLIFASPDVGGTARARAYAKHFRSSLVICDKFRKRPNEVASMQVIGNVEGMDVVLVDDIVDTAGTITKAANLLVEQGAKSVRAVCTHPVLSGPAYERIESSMLEELIVSDTIPLKKESSKIKVLSVENLFAEAIRRVQNNESISTLFIQS